VGRRVALYRRGANIGLKEMYKTPSRVEGLANVFCAGLRWNVAEKCFVGVCGAFFSSEMGLVRAGGRSLVARGALGWERMILEDILSLCILA